MSVKNVQIRKKNSHRLVRKMALCTSAIIIGSIIFKGVTTQHKFHKLGIEADDYTSISSELEEKYNINLEDNSLPCADEIVSFIQDGQAYEEDQSIENRVKYVSSAKNLAYAADDMIKGKIQKATGAKIEDITLPEKRDKSVGNYIPIALVNQKDYNLPDEIMDLIVASNEVTQYNGTGKNEAWDDDINEFSNDANKLFTEIVKSNYSLELNGQDLSVTTTTAYNPKGK